MKTAATAAFAVTLDVALTAGAAVADQHASNGGREKCYGISLTGTE